MRDRYWFDGTNRTVVGGSLLRTVLDGVTVLTVLVGLVLRAVVIVSVDLAELEGSTLRALLVGTLEFLAFASCGYAPVGFACEGCCTGAAAVVVAGGNAGPAVAG